MLMLVALLAAGAAGMRIVDQHIAQPSDGFAFLQKFNFDTSGTGRLVVDKVASGSEDELKHTSLVVYYDSHWLPIYANSSLTCTEKVSAPHPRATFSFEHIRDHIRNAKAAGNENATWTLKVTEHKRPHLWYLVAANCEQGHVSNFTWSASFLQAEEGLYHQVTYERQTLYYCYLLFAIGWTFVGLPFNVFNTIQLARAGAFHPVVQLFTATLVVYTVSLWMQWIHKASYAGNGLGLPGLDGLGVFLDMVSDVVFMLMLVLLAQGWAISKHSIEHRMPMLGGAVVLVLLDVVLVLCMNYAIAPERTVFMYVTVPGIFLLLLRCLVLLVFVVFILRSIKDETDASKRRFFVLIGSIFSLYLVSLPVVALLSATFPYWTSYKITIWLYSLCKSAGLVVMLVLLSPRFATAYFSITQVSLLDGPSTGGAIYGGTSDL